MSIYPQIDNVIRAAIRPVIGSRPKRRAGFSPAATDYFARLGDLRVTTYDKANAALVDRLVGNGGNFWPDSGAFCAMAGYLYPGTTLVPLHPNHDAGTLNAFVSGDWNAVTGLKGDGSTNFVDSNRNNNADGQNDQVNGLYISEGTASDGVSSFIDSGGTTGRNRLGSNTIGGTHRVVLNNRNETTTTVSTFLRTGYVAMSRLNATEVLVRFSGNNATVDRDSQTPHDANLIVFESADIRSNFYHIGPGMTLSELAELDAALTEWKNALAATL